MSGLSGLSGIRRPPVRALTFGVAARHPLAEEDVRAAAGLVQRAAESFAGEGYEVQTVRLSTRPVLSDLAGWDRKALVQYACSLQEALDGAGIEFCSLGPAFPSDRPGGLDGLGGPAPQDGPAALADMLAGDVAGGDPPGTVAGTGAPGKGNTSLSASVMVTTREHGVDVAIARAAARAILSLAGRTAQGLGNFNFAALGCVAPGTPFFPAAYHDGPASLAVALQGAGVVREALAGGAELGGVEARTREKLTAAAHPVAALAKRVAAKLGATFAGIDLSPAPDVDDSIVGALEGAGHGTFGGPGTLALAAAVTSGVRSTGLPMCGYSGLMLPVMEDPVLASRWDAGLVGIDQLLAWSSVCGTGIDTVPVPGDAEPDLLAGIICDMASLAARLRKPLSARLLPAPGKVAGERTQFASPYLVNVLIKPLTPQAAISSPL